MNIQTYTYTYKHFIQIRNHIYIISSHKIQVLTEIKSVKFWFV
jgi:hypothetical protein